MSECVIEAKCNYAMLIFKKKKSVDGVLGIRNWGRRMVGADETTELWRPPAKICLLQ